MPALLQHAQSTRTNWTASRVPPALPTRAQLEQTAPDQTALLSLDSSSIQKDLSKVNIKIRTVLIEIPFLCLFFSTETNFVSSAKQEQNHALKNSSMELAVI